MNSVRWGLLSTAAINRRVIPALRASRRGELAAVASRNQDQADAYAAEWGIPKAFGSYEAMLSSDSVDAVYVSLPNHLHAEWTVRALRAGKNVLCEKPFALSLEEVDRMISVARETGLALAEAFMYRHHPQTKLVGEWVKGGRLGEITVLQGMFNFRMEGRENVRLVPGYGGGSLWDIGVYPISFAQYVMGGPPEWVTGEQWLGDTGVDEVFSGQMHYDGGRTAQFTSGFRTPFRNTMLIAGNDGYLVLDRAFLAMDDGDQHLFFHPADGEPRAVEVPQKELYLGEVEDMEAAILDGEANYLTLAESRNHVRTALALYEAASSGERVHLDQG